MGKETCEGLGPVVILLLSMYQKAARLSTTINKNSPKVTARGKDPFYSSVSCLCSVLSFALVPHT